MIKYNLYLLCALSISTVNAMIKYSDKDRTKLEFLQAVQSGDAQQMEKLVALKRTYSDLSNILANSGTTFEEIYQLAKLRKQESACVASTLCNRFFL